MASRPESRGGKLPPLQTSTIQRPATAPHTGTPTATNFNGRPAQINGYTPETDHHDSARSDQSHQRFVLTDPVAFRYLEEDPATKVLQRRQELQGYECYIVEQWTTSRSHPTFTITTYTGDPAHVVVVGVLSVPTDEATWSPRLRVYFKALNQYHAKRRETPLGILMVTNLSGFPSSLTVIQVPDGDLRRHRSDFFVNENLKRLNCTGRVGLTLAPPSGATVAKFHQLYRTSDKNDIYQSVIELVKLCQSSLMLFDKLEIDYADGLLCDITERAVNDWWMEIGAQYYSIEPHDGILGPTTVSGLLGLLMGARNRLHSMSAPVGKDPLDVDSMKKGISTFQKQQRIPRTRRLDRRTLDRLHKLTQKAANSDGYWAVPKAVKSTVAELSGKGGERAMDVVGRRDRAGIAEIETCDIERFVQLVFGERARWLWYGRALKTKSAKESVGVPVRPGELGKELSGKSLSFHEGEHGGYTWTTRKSVADGMGAALKGRVKEEDGDEVGTPVEQSEDEGEGIRGVIKRTSGFKEARSGIGRIRGAVGLGHSQKQSKDTTDRPSTPKSPQTPRQSTEESGKERPKRPPLMRAHSSPVSQRNIPQSPLKEQNYQSTYQSTLGGDSIPESPAIPSYAASYREGLLSPSKDSMPSWYNTNDMQNGSDRSTGHAPDSDREASTTVTAAPSIAGSIYNDVSLNDVLPTGPETGQNVERLLQRTMSYSRFVSVNLESHSGDVYPRHLSFSLAEDSVLTWDELFSRERDPYFNDAKALLADEDFFAAELKHLRHLIGLVSSSTATFTQDQLHTLGSLVQKLDTDQETLDAMYHPHAEQVHGLQSSSEGMLRTEKERLEEAGKEIETLVAKLEYEINGLKGRVEEASAAVGDFEKGVGRIEDRVSELEKDEEKGEKGWSCSVQ